MTRTPFALAIAGLLAVPATGQIFTESFENAPGGTYTLTTAFDAGFDYFGQYASPDNSNGARDDFQNGFDGAFAIHGQDIDAAPNATSAIGLITIPGIDISSLLAPGFVTGSFGALNSEPNFNNYEIADGDRLSIFATIDAGARTLIGQFAPTDIDDAGAPATASDLFRDINLDGLGDRLPVNRLTTDLTDYSFLLPGIGSSLTLEIELVSTDSFEPLVVDNIRVVPEPASLALLGLGGLAMLRRRA